MVPDNLIPEPVCPVAVSLRAFTGDAESKGPGPIRAQSEPLPSQVHKGVLVERGQEPGDDAEAPILRPSSRLLDPDQRQREPAEPSHSGAGQGQQERREEPRRSRLAHKQPADVDEHSSHRRRDLRESVLRA